MNLTTDQKIDRLLQIIEGDGDDAPGLVGRLAHVERDFYGHKNDLGVRTKVTIMWRVHMWILCTASALAGYALRVIFSHL